MNRRFKGGTKKESTFSWAFPLGQATPQNPWGIFPHPYPLGALPPGPLPKGGPFGIPEETPLGARGVVALKLPFIFQRGPHQAEIPLTGFLSSQSIGALRGMEFWRLKADEGDFRLAHPRWHCPAWATKKCGPGRTAINERGRASPQGRFKKGKFRGNKSDTPSVSLF